MPRDAPASPKSCFLGCKCKGLHLRYVKAYIDSSESCVGEDRRIMALIGSALLLVVFAVNVGLGAVSNSAFLSDVGEMLLLLSAAVLFVVAILKKEADAKK